MTSISKEQETKLRDVVRSFELGSMDERQLLKDLDESIYAIRRFHGES